MTLMIEQQSFAFLVSILCGFIIGLFIEIRIALKKVIKPNKVIEGINDVLFWLILCGVVIWITFTYNDGQIRFFIFLGFFSGIGIYFSTINWVISKIFDYILCVVKNGSKKVILCVKKLVDIIKRKR